MTTVFNLCGNSLAIVVPKQHTQLIVVCRRNQLDHRAIGKDFARSPDDFFPVRRTVVVRREGFAKAPSVSPRRLICVLIEKFEPQARPPPYRNALPRLNLVTLIEHEDYENASGGYKRVLKKYMADGKTDPV